VAHFDPGLNRPDARRVRHESSRDLHDIGEDAGLDALELEALRDSLATEQTALRLFSQDVEGHARSVESSPADLTLQTDTHPDDVLVPSP
jgi:hypothetical protein